MKNLFSWAIHGDGKTLHPGEVVEPDERLTWGRTAGIGAQHVVAMFGATFLVPILTGFDPSTTLFFTAMSTALFLLDQQERPAELPGLVLRLHRPDRRRHHGEQGPGRRQLRHHGHRSTAGPDRPARALRRLQVDRRGHAAGRQRRHRGHHRLQPGPERVEQLPARPRHRAGHPGGRAGHLRAVQGPARPSEHPARRHRRLHLRLLPRPGRLLRRERGRVDRSAEVPPAAGRLLRPADVHPGGARAHRRERRPRQVRGADDRPRL